MKNSALFLPPVVVFALSALAVAQRPTLYRAALSYPEPTPQRPARHAAQSHYQKLRQIENLQSG